MGTRSTPTVLIADDDPWIRESLTFLLHDEGYETLEATNGVETLDLLLLNSSPLLVLLDLVMPVMTGFEVLAHISQDATLATRHRYIILSARPYSLATRRAPHFSDLLERLAIPFVEKSFDLDHLLRVVQATFSQLAAEQPRQGNGGQSA